MNGNANVTCSSASWFLPKTGGGVNLTIMKQPFFWGQVVWLEREKPNSTEFLIEPDTGSWFHFLIGVEFENDQIKNYVLQPLPTLQELRHQEPIKVKPERVKSFSREMAETMINALGVLN